MIVLILGVGIFFGIHMLPAFRINQALITRFGEKPYKLAFTVVSFAGLGLIIYGFKLAPFSPLWPPVAGAREAAMAIMPIAIILLCSADAPNNIKRWVRHPMLIGVTLWGASHLAANGDLASTLIFASFAVFSVLDIVMVETSGRARQHEPVSHAWDAAVVVIGLVLYGVLFYFHGSFTGMPLV